MYIIVLHHYSNIVLHHSANIVLQYFAKLYYTTVLTLYYTTVLTLYYITTVTLYYITALTLYYIIVLRILTSCSSSNICRGWTDNSSWAPPSDHACAQASLQPCQRFRIASDYKCHVRGRGPHGDGPHGNEPQGLYYCSSSAKLPGDSDVHMLLVKGKPVSVPARSSNTYLVMKGTTFLTASLTLLSSDIVLPQPQNIALSPDLSPCPVRFLPCIRWSPAFIYSLTNRLLQSSGCEPPMGLYVSKGHPPESWLHYCANIVLHYCANIVLCYCANTVHYINVLYKPYYYW